MGRQGREFTLDGLFEVGIRHKRIRRPNRRERGMSPPNHRCWPGSYLPHDRPEGRCLAPQQRRGRTAADLLGREGQALRTEASSSGSAWISVSA